MKTSSPASNISVPPLAHIDVCIVSSGLFDPKLDAIAKKNAWSYIATKTNCVPLAQNIAISLHPNAELIYKMDEDIFVTRHSFHTLMETYQKIRKEDTYDISFVAPLIPINGYGHIRILQKLGMTGLYTKLFEKPKYAAILDHMIGTSPDVAKFFWGEYGAIPSIDYLDEEFNRQDFKYGICPGRFNIGFILMPRLTWKIMGGWAIPEDGAGMGMDEYQIGQLSALYSYVMVVSENTVVGHLSFGPQNEAMRKYHATHREIFRCPAE